MMIITEKVNLKNYNSFGVDAIADRIIEFDTVESLREIFERETMPLWSILSGGNNILFTNQWRGVLLHPLMKGISIVVQNSEWAKVRVEAAVEWDDFVAWAVDNGLWGVENLSLIPGYVGASPVQNIGAYGVEVKDVVESIEMFCVDTHKILTLSASHCQFGYRDSVFKHSLKGKVVITAVNFTLSYTPSPKLGYGDLKNSVEQHGGPTLENIRNSVIEIRQSKLPDPSVLGNAGSFFKNPVVAEVVAERLRAEFPNMPLYPNSEGVKLASGWLIDKAGWRGFCDTTVGVHSKQALILINLGGATGADVLDLASRIQQDVATKFGVEIEMEVNIL